MRRPGSSLRNVASVTSSPNTTPGAFWVISARADARPSTVEAVVMSPVPTSSASARAAASRMTSSFTANVGSPVA